MKEDLQNELKDIEATAYMSEKDKKKKLGIWIIRTLITFAILLYFWNNPWTKWVLLLYIPLSAFSLYTILNYNKFIKKRIEKTMSKIDNLDIEE